MTTLYEDLYKAGCHIENHESDLYVKATKIALSILESFDIKYTLFVSELDKHLWAEVPFAYDPFWEQRSSVTGDLVSKNIMSS